MKCPRCDFESDAARLVVVHYEATHAQEMILEIAAGVRERERQGKNKPE